MSRPSPSPGLRPLKLLRRAGTLASDFTHVGLRYAAAALAQRRVRPDDFATPKREVPGCTMPVALVPGIYEPWRYLLPMARSLHRAGHPVHVLPTLGWNGWSIDRSAELVLDQLHAAGVREAVLVAHSKGGLIGKQALLRQDATCRLHGMVAVCTPFAGSSLVLPPLARLPLGRSTIGIFHPRHKVIQGLGLEREINRHIVSIGSAWDQMIPEGSALPGAANLTVDVPGHFRPVAHPRVMRAVHESVHDILSRKEEAPWN